MVVLIQLAPLVERKISLLTHVVLMIMFWSCLKLLMITTGEAIES